MTRADHLATYSLTVPDRMTRTVVLTTAHCLPWPRLPRCLGHSSLLAASPHLAAYFSRLHHYSRLLRDSTTTRDFSRLHQSTIAETFTTSSHLAAYYSRVVCDYSRLQLATPPLATPPLYSRLHHYSRLHQSTSPLADHSRSPRHTSPPTTRDSTTRDFTSHTTSPLLQNESADLFCGDQRPEADPDQLATTYGLPTTLEMVQS
ncbi:hypothetical protein BDZ97DRAFT_753348 [Flammula alnicola]|nr:hypothetical protein BDZ97DRAFT_753348 [Flammula alnicola]